jgi:hypothetical protein
MPPVGGNLNSKTEATDVQYTQIATSNNVRWQSGNPGRDDEAFMWYDMQIDEYPNWITQIDLVFEGYGEINGTFQIWAYDYSTSVWIQIGIDQEIVSGSDSTMIRSINSGFNNYISGAGILTWGVFFDETTTDWFTDGYWVATDYVRAVVNYTPGSTPTPTSTPSVVPTKTPCVKTFSFLSGAGTDKWAYEGNNGGGQPPTSGPHIDNQTEFTTYSNVSISDDDRYATSIWWLWTLYPAHHFEFIIDEDVADITSLYVEWEGYGSLDDSNLYVWNFSGSGGWEHVGGHSLTSSDGTITTTFTSGIENYIDISGYLHLAATTAVVGWTNGDLFTDYVEVEITYMTFTCP